ncbi:uncharacterized protein BYT42DRAFT_36894 [Radiomyces spectabilis]|uniref:uncharacterized protein n=1 Tax=Radiomyces spectabilis TaxID=64574 RepID=UPI00221E6EDD|nr:uncharacterized protein BYT42DRAFT_36894 [Radiomyces spectabilis]KAI8394257.1 hypothetical protein BYT42DRAFT_36894 [Radiomyces spectabilis]
MPERRAPSTHAFRMTDPRTWSVDQVCDWAQKTFSDNIARLIRDHHIDGKTLVHNVLHNPPWLSLTLNIKDKALRKRIRTRLRRLKDKWPDNDATAAVNTENITPHKSTHPAPSNPSSSVKPSAMESFSHDRTEKKTDPPSRRHHSTASAETSSHHHTETSTKSTHASSSTSSSTSKKLSKRPSSHAESSSPRVETSKKSTHTSSSASSSTSKKLSKRSSSHAETRKTVDHPHARSSKNVSRPTVTEYITPFSNPHPYESRGKNRSNSPSRSHANDGSKSPTYTSKLSLVNDVASHNVISPAPASDSSKKPVFNVETSRAAHQLSLPVTDNNTLATTEFRKGKLGRPIDPPPLQSSTSHLPTSSTPSKEPVTKPDAMLHIQMVEGEFRKGKLGKPIEPPPLQSSTSHLTTSSTPSKEPVIKPDAVLNIQTVEGEFRKRKIGKPIEPPPSRQPVLHDTSSRIQAKEAATESSTTSKVQTVQGEFRKRKIGKPIEPPPSRPPVLHDNSSRIPAKEATESDASTKAQMVKRESEKVHRQDAGVNESSAIWIDDEIEERNVQEIVDDTLQVEDIDFTTPVIATNANLPAFTDENVTITKIHSPPIDKRESEAAKDYLEFDELHAESPLNYLSFDNYRYRLDTRGTKRRRPLLLYDDENPSDQRGLIEISVPWPTSLKPTAATQRLPTINDAPVPSPESHENKRMRTRR